MVARRWRTHATFVREYARAAAGVDDSLVRAAPGREQYERWLAGKVKTVPYPHHCQVLEAMFPGHRAEDLLAPPLSQPLPEGAMTAPTADAQPRPGRENPGEAVDDQDLGEEDDMKRRDLLHMGRSARYHPR